ncbi:DUF4396 domain-containing protein [Mycolicibacterium moriokaense]|nr:DUF4396 domain-containing protein [Mycolicibacterium moriokaense]
MLDGAMLLWWILTVPSFLFVAVDVWRTTPESPVLKWAFVILTAFTGPLGAFFYVLGCREPLAGTHEQYVAARWRQVLGSTMHCVAGDGIGIVAGAAIAAAVSLTFWPDFALEYVLGFGFGWVFFQAFAMRDMAGGSFLRSLRMTVLPELLSMNLLMTGMVLTSRFAMKQVEGSHDPARPEFWFIMSMALIVGFVCAYPINWWLVANRMKHGMLTVRKQAVPAAMAGMEHASMDDMDAAEEADAGQPSAAVKAAMTVLTIVILATALLIVSRFAL